MDILIVAPFYPYHSMPYAGLFIAEQARMLRELGVRANVVTFVPRSPWPLPLLRAKWKRFAEVPDSYSWHGVPVTVFRYLTLPRSLSLGLSAQMMEEALRRDVAQTRPSLIHAHFAYPAGLAAIRCGKHFGIPTILTVHGSDVHTLPNIAAKYRDGVTEALASANRVLAVSDFLSGAVFNLSGRRDVLVQRIGVDLQRFAACDRNAERSAVPELAHIQGPIVLFVGNLLHAKGVLDLLTAFREIREVAAHLVYVGDGPLAKEIARRRYAYGLQEQVHLLGARPNTVVPTLLNAADVFVLPSYKEGLPMSCVEALACERPVIASDVGGIPEIVKHNHTGLLVPPGDPAALAVGLRRLLSDSTFARELAQAGRRLVEQQHDLEKNTKVLMGIYQEVS